MPTLTLGDLDRRITALDTVCSGLAHRIRALEAANRSADTSVSPEPRSADSGPENARHEEEIADLKQQLVDSQALVREHIAENARIERMLDVFHRRITEQAEEINRLRSRLEKAKEAARRELADELLEKLGVSNDG